MSEELERIEKMLAEGKVTPEEAERLRKALSDSLEREPEGSQEETPSRRKRRGPGPVVRVLGWVMTLVVCAGAVCLGLFVPFVLPKLTQMFMEMDVQLPAMTRLLISVPLPVYPLLFIVLAIFVFAKELVLWERMNTLLINLGALLLLAASLFVLVVSLYMPMRNLVQHLEKSRGSEAALLLAEDGRALLDEYQQFIGENPNRPWKPKKLDLAKLNSNGQLRLLDAVVLSDQTLIASASERPLSLSGRVVPGPDPGVEVLRGSCIVNGRKLNCLQYKVPFQQGGRRGVARIVVRLDP